MDRLCAVSSQHRGGFRVPRSLLVLAISVVLSGCGDVEWNWQADWWREPRRVVRPTLPQNPPKSEDFTPEREERTTAGPEVAEDNPEVAAGTPAAADTAPVRPAALNRAFYQLYLLSGESKPEEVRGEQQVRLRHVAARTCAAALEMLYVPLGRSGSAADCYLLYEDRAEFEAAASIAPLLDVPALTQPRATVGPNEALTAGVGMLLGIIEQGPVVDQALAASAEARLMEAAQADGLDERMRWAAGVLAGRVASEYRYDYAAARSDYAQAARVTTADTLEQAVALYWRADAWTLQGRRAESIRLYEEILEGYGPKAPKSELVRRAQSVLRKSQKK